MTKKELVQKISERTKLTRKDSALVVDIVLDEIINALKRKEKVLLSGFGTFTVRNRTEREGRNPKSGQKMYIKARQVPAFKAGKTLLDAVKD